MNHVLKTSAVDGNDRRELLIVGRGKLARHLLFAFRALSPDVSLLQWDRSQSQQNLQNFAQRAAVIFLCISDDSLEEMANLLRSFAPSGLLVHHSGTKNLNGAWSLHPLMTFSGEEAYPREIYEQIPFIISPPKDDPKPQVSVQEIFETCFSGWKNNFHLISPEQKVFYHLNCVIAGNFATLLWQEAAKNFEKLDLPPEILRPYLERTLANFLKQPFGSFTGPLQRGDSSTIHAHLEVLKGQNFSPIYEAFLKYAQANKDLRGIK